MKRRVKDNKHTHTKIKIKPKEGEEKTRGTWTVRSGLVGGWYEVKKPAAERKVQKINPLTVKYSGNYFSRPVGRSSASSLFSSSPHSSSSTSQHPPQHQLRHRPFLLLSFLFLSTFPLLFLSVARNCHLLNRGPWAAQFFLSFSVPFNRRHTHAPKHNGGNTLLSEEGERPLNCGFLLLGAHRLFLARLYCFFHSNFVF